MRVLTWLFGLVVLPAAVLAQQVTGSVHDSAGGLPVPGVVVIVLDSAGKAGARTITDASGAFTVPALLSASALRLMRIGYRPRELAIGPRTGPMQIAMERVPAILDQVRVSGAEVCPGSPDRGVAFQLWEQARAGLLATIVAREQKPATVTTLVYESILSPSDELVRRQQKQLQSGRTRRPFVSSAPPAEFARVGYLDDAPSGRVFNAPDADVLMDESFATTHCFRLRSADIDHLGQIGLAFAPTPGRDTIVDVTGVLWLDEGTPQLRTLDFLYTSLEPAAARARTGGHIEFRTMPNGVAFIERWRLRLANLESNTRSGLQIRRDASNPLRRWERLDVVVADIVEVGGIVVDARWADGTTWLDTPSALSGLVTRRKSNGPVADAIVTLVGTSDTTATDNAGEFEFQVIPGKYLVAVTDTSLKAFVAARTERQAVRAAPATVTAMHVEMPAVGETTASVCRAQRSTENSVLITGHAVMTDASAVRNGAVRAEWQEETASGEPESRTQRVGLDGAGRFVICGLQRDRGVRLVLFTGANRLADTTFRIADVAVSHQVEWRVAPIVASAESATLDGTIVDAESKLPIAGAEVSIPSLERSATSGPDGVFRLLGLRPGRWGVVVRHIGNDPVADTIRLDARARVTRAFALRRAIVLDTMRSVARASSANLRAFETHRATRQGSYVTDSALRARSGQRLADVLRNLVEDLRILRAGSETYVVAPSRGRVLSGFRNASRCVSTVYIDGELRYDARETIQRAFSITQYYADDFAAIEFYGGNMPVPVEFRRVKSDCGTLVLWTRK